MKLIHSQRELFSLNRTLCQTALQVHLEAANLPHRRCLNHRKDKIIKPKLICQKKSYNSEIELVKIFSNATASSTP